GTHGARSYARRSDAEPHDSSVVGETPLRGRVDPRSSCIDRLIRVGNGGQIERCLPTRAEWRDLLGCAGSNLVIPKREPAAPRCGSIVTAASPTEFPRDDRLGIPPLDDFLAGEMVRIVGID